MEVERKKEPEPEAEGARVEERPRWQQHLEKHPGDTYCGSHAGYPATE